MVSRLTALPETTFFHSESGNSGQSDWLVSERLVALGSIVYASISLRVLARLSDNTVHLSFLPATHQSKKNSKDQKTLVYLEHLHHLISISEEKHTTILAWYALYLGHDGVNNGRFKRI